MSLDDVIDSGTAFAKSMMNFVKSRKMVYTSIIGTLGLGGWGYADIKHHLDIIQSTPAYRKKVDNAIHEMDSTNKAIKTAVVPLLIIKDSLTSMIEREQQLEYRVNENMDLIDLMYEDYYDFKYKIDYRVSRLE